MSEKLGYSPEDPELIKYLESLSLLKEDLTWTKDKDSRDDLVSIEGKIHHGWVAVRALQLAKLAKIPLSEALDTVEMVVDGERHTTPFSGRIGRGAVILR